MNFTRASGVLLHPTSLPGKYGIGDFGPEAFGFVDFLQRAGQAYWQILPLGPTGYGDSPYQSFSAFAGNTNLISPEKLFEARLLKQDDLDGMPGFGGGRVDYGKVHDWKGLILRQAFQQFRTGSENNLREDFEAFCLDNAGWLDDYALYRAVQSAKNHKPWYEWEKELRLRDEAALSRARVETSGEIEAQKFYQFVFFRQWSELKSYANDRGVSIIGDVPIFVALDSADVWHNPREFKLNEDGSPKVVAGVPADYFSKTGQRWGNPIYDWDEMRDNGFRWWIERVRHTLKMVDIIRVDHFRGFAAAWEIPGGDKTAENGQWVTVPGRELFTALREKFGELPVMAEDLGVITDDVRSLRDEFEFPGMRILQYAFGSGSGSDYLPHNYVRNCVVYTGTHDNDTVVGWFKSLRGRSLTPGGEREYCLRYLDSDGKQIHRDFIRAAWASIADTAIAPLQDVLGLGNDARMNLPASTSGNWNWRCAAGDFSDGLIAWLREITETYGRFKAK
jgi:4-alpha-glucanotransferase